MPKKSRKIEFLFENMLWKFRFIVILPVIFSLLSSLIFFVIGTLDICEGFTLSLDILKFNDEELEKEITYHIVSYIIGGIDYYLIGIVLLIFGLGIYELFISEIDVRFEQQNVTFQREDINLLQSESLEELKGKLVKVIVVALIVSFFKKILTLEVQQARDLVYVAFSILLIALSNYLLQYSNHNKKV